MFFGIQHWPSFSGSNDDDDHQELQETLALREHFLICVTDKNKNVLPSLHLSCCATGCGLSTAAKVHVRHALRHTFYTTCSIFCNIINSVRQSSQLQNERLLNMSRRIYSKDVTSTQCRFRSSNQETSFFLNFVLLW